MGPPRPLTLLALLPLLLVGAARFPGAAPDEPADIVVCATDQVAAVPLAGVTVTLKDALGFRLDTLTTAADGCLRFADINVGAARAALGDYFSEPADCFYVLPEVPPLDEDFALEDCGQTPEMHFSDFEGLGRRAP